MGTISLGVDLAKCVFAVCEIDAAGRVVRRREFKRDAFAMYLAQLPAGTVVAMEACSGAHHWARRCREYGLVPRLMAAQFVRPFRKNPVAKNDPNDAEAIATAARQGNMRFVPVKDIDQQARLSWHRVREGYKGRTPCDRQPIARPARRVRHRGAQSGCRAAPGAGRSGRPCRTAWRVQGTAALAD